MKEVLAFISILLPQLSILGPAAAQLIPMFRAAFKKVGGADADFQKILDENQVLIDRLGDPDSFRRLGPKGTTPTGEFPYTEELTEYPDESRLKSGDKIHQYRTESRYIVIGDFGRDPDAEGWHLVKTMP